MFDPVLFVVLIITIYSVHTQTHDKKVAEKFVKNIIKLSIKIGLLIQNEQFSKEELQVANNFAARFRSISMTITSFMEVRSVNQNV